MIDDQVPKIIDILNEIAGPAAPVYIRGGSSVKVLYTPGNRFDVMCEVKTVREAELVRLAYNAGVESCPSSYRDRLIDNCGIAEECEI